MQRKQNQEKKNVLNICKSVSWLAYIHRSQALIKLKSIFRCTKANPLFINKNQFEQMRLLVALLSIMPELETQISFQQIEAISHSTQDILGRRSQRFIRCPLAVLGSQRISAFLIWSGRLLSNKTGVMMKLVHDKLWNTFYPRRNI